MALGLEHIYDLIHARDPMTQNQLLFRSRHPSAWWLRKVLRMHTPVAGDEDDSVADRVHSKGADGPNLAWSRMNGGKYVPSSSRGARIDGMYKWGYCLWATPRLNAWGAMNKSWIEKWYS